MFTKSNPILLERRKMLRLNMTPEEHKIWKYLKSSRTGYKWRRQYSIGNYIVDFVCIEKRIIIEIDGGDHLEKIEYDRKRQEYIESKLWKFLRFGNNEVRENSQGVMERVYLELSVS